jgi:hypothetical protein
MEEQSIIDAATIVCQELTSSWEKARIPTKRVDHIIEKIKKLHETYRGLQKHSQMEHTKHVDAITRFQDSLDDLFDNAHAKALGMITIQEDRLLKFAKAKG